MLNRHDFADGLIDCLSTENGRVWLTAKPLERLASSHLSCDASGADIVCAIETTLAFVSFLARGGISASDPSTHISLDSSWPILEDFIEALVTRLDQQAEAEAARGTDLRQAWQKIRRKSLADATGSAGLTPKTELGSIAVARGTRER